MTSNMPEYYKEVSMRLNGVLDTIGLREDIRWKRINMWIQSEEASSLWIAPEVVHYFGSQAEATTTPGLQSDIDRVTCVDFAAVQDIESSMPDVSTFLVVSDENTPPGYVKLHGVSSKKPFPIYKIQNKLLKLDRHGRSVFSSDASNIRLVEHSERHGPADTKYLHRNITIDSVLAVRINAWPDQASQWLTRKRNNWPTQETILLIQQTGALVVPVGHKLSEEEHLEWRLSISFGEKILVWLLNSTQYKCYILLKMINKTFIKPIVGSDALSSYHCKTCIFYLVENTSTTMWQPGNLLLCLDLCLRLLYSWVESIICPNYFIPEENMFLCKVYGLVRGKMLGVLSNLLRQGGRYLLGISCDTLGQTLLRVCQTPLTDLDLNFHQVEQVLWTSVAIMDLDLRQNISSAVRNDLIFKPHILSRVFLCQEPRLEINTILWKHYCSFIGSKLASETLADKIPNRHNLYIAKELLLWGSSSDMASGKLKLDAFYFVQDNLDLCKDVLNDLHENYKTLDYSMKYQNRLQAMLSENLSTSQLISQYIAFPVLYHPSEIRCTPKALWLEFFRSTGSDFSAIPKNRLVLKLVSIDPKVYLYFLEYLCHHRQNNMTHKKSALDNLIYVIRHDVLNFKDTALSLLAFCMMKDGRFKNA